MIIIKHTRGSRRAASRATATAAVPVLAVLPFRLVEAAWGLVEVMLVVLVCNRRGCVSRAAAAPIAIPMYLKNIIMR